jgi:hypothetical protein
MEIFFLFSTLLLGQIPWINCSSTSKASNHAACILLKEKKKRSAANYLKIAVLFKKNTTSSVCLAAFLTKKIKIKIPGLMSTSTAIYKKCF